MKVQYIADDGTIFEDEYECQKYESRIIYDNEFKGCLFYDYNKKELILSNETLEDVWYAHFETLDQLEKFKELNEKERIFIDGLDDINKIYKLDFYYDNEEDQQKFKQYDVKLSELISQVNELTKEKCELFYTNI